MRLCRDGRRFVGGFLRAWGNRSRRGARRTQGVVTLGGDEPIGTVGRNEGALEESFQDLLSGAAVHVFRKPRDRASRVLNGVREDGVLGRGEGVLAHVHLLWGGWCDVMNALVAMEAKRFLLYFDDWLLAPASKAARRASCRLQTATSWKSRRSGFQGLDPKVLLGDLGQELVDLVHGCFREEVIEVERMNALLRIEAKRILKKD